MRCGLIGLAALLLGGCLHTDHLRECEEGQLQSFSRDVDEIVRLRHQNTLDDDAMADLLAIRALQLRRNLNSRCK